MHVCSMHWMHAWRGGEVDRESSASNRSVTLETRRGMLPKGGKKRGKVAGAGAEHNVDALLSEAIAANQAVAENLAAQS